MSLSFKAAKLYPFYLGKRAVLESKNPIQVVDKFTGKNVTEISSASPQVIKEAIEKASATQPELQVHGKIFVSILMSQCRKWLTLREKTFS